MDADGSVTEISVESLLGDSAAPSPADAGGIAYTIEQRTTAPILKADRSWEPVVTSPSVVRENETTWHMWYVTYLGSQSALCYASSTDGITWNKPNLGLVSIGGSTANNVTNLLPGETNLNVFLDPQAPASERFKAVYTMPYPSATDVKAFYVYGATSANGKVWQGKSAPLLARNSDTQPVVFRDGNVYRMYVRMWSGGAPFIGHRQVGYTESTTFGAFPEPRVILEADALDPAGLELYNSAATRLGSGRYVMFPSGFSPATGLLVPRFATSRDGTQFSRPSHSESLSLGTGFDSKQIAVAPGAVPGAEAGTYWFYYVGAPFTHGYTPRSPNGIGRFLLRVSQRPDTFTDSFDTVSPIARWNQRVPGISLVAGRATTAATASGVALAIADGLGTAANVELSSQFALGTSNATRAAGLVARYQGPGDKSMYLGWVGVDSGIMVAEIQKNVGGTWTRLARANIDPATNAGRTKTGRLVFTAIGTTLTVKIDGNTVLSISDGALASGLCGVRFYGPGASLDDFAFGVSGATPCVSPQSVGVKHGDRTVMAAGSGGLKPFFPQIAIFPDGELLGTYYWSTTHGAEVPGTLEMVRSTDHGKTWSAPTTIVDWRAQGLDARGSAFTVLNNGDVLLIFTSVKYYGLTDPRTELRIHTAISHDRGRTFGDFRVVTQGPVTLATGEFAYGRALQQADDSIVISAYGVNFGGNVSRTMILKSTDYGNTWRRITVNPTLGSEMAIASLGNGRLMGTLREVGDIYESEDGGETWTRRYDTGGQLHGPDMLALTNDLVLVDWCEPNSTPQGNRALWGRLLRPSARNIDAFTTKPIYNSPNTGIWDMGYSSAVLTKTGLLYIVYYDTSRAVIEGVFGSPSYFGVDLGNSCTAVGSRI